MKNVITMSGVPGETFTMTSTNTAQSLTAANIVGSGGAQPIGALITCETKAVKFCVGGSTPVSSGLGHVIASGGSRTLDSGNAVKTFKFISSAAGQAGTLQITVFFEPGRV